MRPASLSDTGPTRAEHATFLSGLAVNGPFPQLQSLELLVRMGPARDTLTAFGVLMRGLPALKRLTVTFHQRFEYY